MMTLNVDTLPSHFKPYPFKSFRMDAINFKQSQELGSKPSLEDIRKLIHELTHDTIDTSLLVPIDLKYLIASLAFHAFPNQTWSLTLSCPYCHKAHTRVISMRDFPPLPTLEESDEYPLKVDDGVHVFELGYASADAIESIDDKTPPLDLIKAHLIAVDGKTDDEYKVAALGAITNFEIPSVMAQAIRKYFPSETYSETECPHCKEKYRVPLSAVEVTQYTPFRESKTTGGYKTNFRL